MARYGDTRKRSLPQHATTLTFSRQIRLFQYRKQRFNDKSALMAFKRSGVRLPLAPHYKKPVCIWRCRSELHFRPSPRFFRLTHAEASWSARTYPTTRSSKNWTGTDEVGIAALSSGVSLVLPRSRLEYVFGVVLRLESSQTFHGFFREDPPHFVFVLGHGVVEIRRHVKRL